MRRQIYTLEEWKEIFADWEKSGLTLNAYCKAKKLTPSSIYKWKQKINNPNFIPPEVKQAEKLETWKSIIADWERSGLPKALYCHEKGLSDKLFYEWGKKINPPLFTLNKRPLEEKRALINGWKKSGLTRHAYCRKKGFDYSLFCKWEKVIDPASRLILNPLEEWKETVADWERSGLAKAAYCREKHIPLSVFYRWKKKLSFPNSRDMPFFKTPPSHTPEEWQEIIEDWKTTKLTPNSYCRKKHLCLSTFYRWQKKFQSPGFIPQHIKEKEIHERWKTVIEDWEKSGLNKRAYSLKKHLNSSDLYRWEKKINSSPSVYEEVRKKWQPIVEDWQKSELNKYAYCREKGLNYPAFFNWVKKLDPSSPRRFSPAELLKQWEGILKDWEQSSLSRGTYCREKELSSTCFYKWEKKIKALRKAQASQRYRKKLRPKIRLSLKDDFIPVIFNSSALPIDSSVPSSFLSQGQQPYLEDSVEKEDCVLQLADPLRR